MKNRINHLALLCILVFSGFNIKSQDLIIKTNGDTIRAKLTEVGLNAVSYKKTGMPNGPSFILDKSEIVLIKYSNGEIERFNNPGTSKTATTTVTPTNTTNGTSDQSSSTGKNKIEFINNQYFINGEKAKQKDVNRYLEKSKNPAILLGLKAAKGTSLAQKITKITSIPTTIAGSITTLFSVVEGYQLVQRGRATTRTFVNMGLSFVGTLTLPITSKILKKKSDKMYDKLIDMYNLTN